MTKILHSLLAMCLIIVALVSCNTAAKYTKKGNKKFAQGEYDFALQNYQSALSKGGDKPYLNYKIGESFRLSSRLTEAVPFYGKALEGNPKMDTAAFYYALGLKWQGNYEQAKTRLAEYVEKGRSYEFKNRAQKELDNLQLWEQIYKKQTGFKVINAEFLNTKGADYGVVPYGENSLVFASSRNMSKLYRATQTGFLDLFKFTFDGFSANSGVSVPFAAPIYDEDTHEASATFNEDGTMMIFAKSNDGSKKGRKECDLYISYFRFGTWSTPKLMSINTKSAWTSTPMLSPDGKTLYFASDRKGGYGGIDLYKATLEDTAWVNVTNLGAKINSMGNDYFPYLSKGGKFFFASDGQPGLGGLDVFRATRDSSTGSLVVENLGQPVNSQYDDFALVFDNDTTGYLSSNRPGGKGDDDIYGFKYKPLYLVDFYLDGVALAKTDSGNVSLDSVKIKVYKGDSLVLDTLAPKGVFSCKLQKDTDYRIVATKNKFFTQEQTLTTKGKVPSIREMKEGLNDVRLKATLVLEPIILDKDIVIDNIYYDYRQSGIRGDAAKELDKVVKLLVDNPGISIELKSHTDSRGDDLANQKLSQARAESAVEYIVSKGINKDRITAKGYGESDPIIKDEKTDEEFQTNRRTEFKVTKIEILK
jgi:peptidoglycan-associated lipoprotein